MASDIADDRIMASDEPTPPRWSIAPYFLVHDVVRSAHYYRDMRGFQYDQFYGEPPEFCIVWRNGVAVMLKQIARMLSMNANGVASADGEVWDAYIWVDDADALHAEFAAKGVAIVREICDQEYGCRDFDVEDCNGYRLCFGHMVSG